MEGLRTYNIDIIRHALQGAPLSCTKNTSGVKFHFAVLYRIKLLLLVSGRDD